MTHVVIGASLAGVKAVEAMREGGYDGDIVLVGAEHELPYERPPLSKEVLLGDAQADKAFSHDVGWYDEQRIDVRLGTRATGLDTAAKVVTLDDGSTVSYEKLLIATGSRVRPIDVPGADLGGVHYLRTMADSLALRDRLVEGGNVVIVGAGWIGLETAAAARKHACTVTVIEPQPTPLFGVVGPAVGDYFTRLHQGHDVRFRFGDGVEAFEGDGPVTAVLTTSGTRLPADVVVVGVGIVPNTELAADGGLEVENGIVCDASLRSSDPSVYAAGDVANWLNPTLGEHVRVEHWANALNGGAAAGRAMIGEEVSFGPLPYFFSDQYDAGLEYSGHVARGVDADVVLRGDPASGSFMAFWLDGDRVLAGMHVNQWDSLDPVKDLITARTPVDRTRLADPEIPIGS